MADTYWLDYSAGRLSSSVIRAAGYTGAIRYVDSPNLAGGKHITPAEYQELTAAGLSVMLVFEVNEEDPDGGFARGVQYAQRAKAGADWIGYHGPIFFCEDRPSTPSVANWRAYLDGAASVLGAGRVGAYGFFGAMDAAIGHAACFWQAGARRDIRPHVHFWQDNNYQPTVGGIQTDRNLIIHPVTAASPASTPAPQPFYDEEAQVEMPAGTKVQKRIFAAGRPHYLWWLVSQPNKVTVHNVAYVKRTSTTGTAPAYGPVGQPGYPDIRGTFDADRPGPVEFASDVAFVWVEYSCSAESTLAIG